MSRFASLAVLSLSVCLLVGCAGGVKHMTPLQEPINLTPASDKATVLFLRPSTMGFKVQSAVYDVSTESNEIIGIVPAKGKVLHETTPGKHLYMVVSENADFLQADLAPGKLYYVVVRPRMGTWRARFSLSAVDREEAASAKFQNWLSDCQPLEANEETRQWARKNAASVNKKQDGYYQKWNAKPDDAKPTLRPEDGN